MKDILIDANFIHKFENPVSPEIKKFITWLMNHGNLVICDKLIMEYNKCCGSSSSPTSIIALLSILGRESRINNVSKSKIKEFKIKKDLENKLRSEKKDRPILISVMLSERKMGLTLDSELKFDINNYPSYNARAYSDLDEDFYL